METLLEDDGEGSGIGSDDEGVGDAYQKLVEQREKVTERLSGSGGPSFDDLLLKLSNGDFEENEDEKKGKPKTIKRPKKKAKPNSDQKRWLAWGGRR